MQIDLKGTLRDLSFNIDGHKLHSIFWQNMAAPGTGGGSPGGESRGQDHSGFRRV